MMSSESGKAGTQKALAAGGLLGAILASTCCILPLVFLFLGIGGAWMSNLTALAPYQNWFVAGTIVCLAIGFWLVYRPSKPDCDEADSCSEPRRNRMVIIILWSATVLVCAAIAVNYLAVNFI